MPTDKDLLDIANSSGFPLQIAVENLVRNNTNNDWHIRHSEHAWKSYDSDLGGFIDLVIDDDYMCVFVIECKRVKDSSWVFLRSSEASQNPRSHCRSWISNFDLNHKPKYFGWGDVTVEPPTPEAAFCAVRGQLASGSRPMLERVAGELIAATESLAIDERDFRHPGVGSFRYYFSILVTTATLHICESEPKEIEITDGTLPADTEFTEVPYLRFRKQLSLRAQPLTADDYARRAESTANEHTVFIVNVSGLTEFLKNFKFLKQLS